VGLTLLASAIVLMRIWLQSWHQLAIANKNPPKNILNIVSKNVEFDADFESVGKVVTSPTEKLVEHESVGIIYFFTFQNC
jgi:hypothetical protein